jgi:hypothetical protein
VWKEVQYRLPSVLFIVRKIHEIAVLNGREGWRQSHTVRNRRGAYQVANNPHTLAIMTEL